MPNVKKSRLFFQEDAICLSGDVSHEMAIVRKAFIAVFNKYNGFLRRLSACACCIIPGL
jgi:hypothetical protein